MLFRSRQVWKPKNYRYHSGYSWLEGKKYFPGIKEGKKLIDSTLGCFVTDRVSIDQDAICYMVREEPSKDNPDSGWRIFAGDETQGILMILNIRRFSL